MKPLTLNDVACASCGHTGHIKGIAFHPETGATRYYCHTQENNCFNAQLGHYFDDLAE